MAIPRKILVATTNPGKRAELARFLVSWPTKLHFLDEFSFNTEPKETGATFKENALIKARFYAEQTGLPTLADDGGIEIDALEGEPGVKSRRWPGYEAGDQELIKLTLEKLKNVPRQKRTARLTAVLVLVDPHTGIERTASASVEGLIANQTTRRLVKGFPYRALFIVRAFNKFYDELSASEQEQINHRKKALSALYNTLITTR